DTIMWRTVKVAAECAGSMVHVCAETGETTKARAARPSRTCRNTKTSERNAGRRCRGRLVSRHARYGPAPWRWSWCDRRQAPPSRCALCHTRTGQTALDHPRQPFASLLIGRREASGQGTVEVEDTDHTSI